MMEKNMNTEKEVVNQDIYELMYSDPISYCNGQKKFFEDFIEKSDANPSLCHAYEWGKHMEKEHENTGKSIIDIAEESQNISFGLAPSWTIWAVSLQILLKYWKYNTELREWVFLQKKKYPELYR